MNSFPITHCATCEFAGTSTTCECQVHCWARGCDLASRRADYRRLVRERTLGRVDPPGFTPGTPPREGRAFPIGADNPRVLLVYRRQNSGNVIGLGVNANHSAEALRSIGVTAAAMAIGTAEELRATVAANPGARLVVIEAVWLPAAELAALAVEFPETKFVVRIHSQIAFLQVEPNVLSDCRACASAGRTNLLLSGNSTRFTRFFSEAYGHPCLLLTNLYHGNTAPVTRVASNNGPLRLGSFGALRLQKHHSVSAAAALLAARRLNRPLEFLVNSGRDERSGVLTMLRGMFAGVADARLVEVPWQAASDFRRTIAGLDLHFQLSATETFNLTVADAASQGIPSVVGEAIDWCPPDFRAPVDDPEAAAEVAIRLLSDPSAGSHARSSLDAHQVAARQTWLDALKSIAGVTPIVRNGERYLDRLFRPVRECDYRGHVISRPSCGCQSEVRFCAIGHSPRRSSPHEATVSECLECFRAGGPDAPAYLESEADQ